LVQAGLTRRRPFLAARGAGDESVGLKWTWKKARLPGSAGSMRHSQTTSGLRGNFISLARPAQQAPHLFRAPAGFDAGEVLLRQHLFDRCAARRAWSSVSIQQRVPSGPRGYSQVAPPSSLGHSTAGAPSRSRTSCAVEMPGFSLARWAHRSRRSR
jgi:hypothetical protein